MALTYDTVTDLDTHTKILLFGPSGSGKSFTSAKAGASIGKHDRVAILLLEPNGLPSIRAANPNAIVVTAYDPKRYGKVYVWEVVDEFVRDAMGGVLTAAGVTTIVIDSLTELQRVWRDRCLIDDGVEQKRLALHKMTQQQWGTWTERFRRLLRALRDTPMNLIAVCLTQNETDDDGNITAIVPAFEGKKLPGEVAQFFSAVGFCFKREVKVTVGEGEGARTTTKIEHKVCFQSGGKLVVKPFPGLEAVEEPDPKVWHAKYVAALTAPPAPVAAEPAKQAGLPEAVAAAEAAAATEQPATKAEATPAPGEASTAGTRRAVAAAEAAAEAEATKQAQPERAAAEQPVTKVETTPAPGEASTPGTRRRRAVAAD